MLINVANGQFISYIAYNRRGFMIILSSTVIKKCGKKLETLLVSCTKRPILSVGLTQLIICWAL